MKYDLMLIGPATRDINIDYTGQEVREIGGCCILLCIRAAAASANLFASVKIHPDDTDVLDAFHLDSDHIAVLPAQCTTLMQNTYFTGRPRRRRPNAWHSRCNHSRSDPQRWTAACIIWPVCCTAISPTS